MMKRIVPRYFLAGFLLILYNFCIESSLSYKCVHDDVSKSVIPVTNFSNTTQLFGKREAVDIFSDPFLMHTYLDEVDQAVPENAVHNIKIALKMVADTLKDALKVRHAESPFILDRTSCQHLWKSGINEGRCARAKNSPELCSMKKTDYVIPDTFLGDLIVYESEEGPPRLRIDSGFGAKDANFILFVISRTTSWCTMEDVQAYGSFCRLDIHNRPVAGLLNMCPETFGNRLFQLEHYYNVILHEVIHILGFSHKLFKEFKKCSGITCVPPKNIFETDSTDHKRIVFPEVLDAMREHSNCSQEGFGAPLAKPENDKDPNKITSSHWDPLLMYSSIMTPSVHEDEYVFLDNITLALLASSGWYKVNYTASKNHLIGKGEGCSFGIGNDCDKYKYLCDPKKDSLGCDIQHRTIGKCQSVVPYHYCGVYKPDKSNGCRDDKGKLYMLQVKSFGYDQLCVTYNKNGNKIPTCVLSKCRSTDSMDIRHNSTSWVSCPLSTEVNLNPDTTISCPSDKFCLEEDININATYIDDCKKLALSVRMFFTDPSFSDLCRYNSFKQFKVKTLRRIADSISIPLDYIKNASLVVFKKTFLSFDICPQVEMGDQDMIELLQRVQEFLESSFTSTIKMDEERAVVAPHSILDPAVAVAFSDQPGLVMLSVVPVTSAIFMIATLVATLVRAFRVRVQRPQKPKQSDITLESLPSNIENESSSQQLV